ncbi:MAG: type II toxin-antitoxin system HicA family toxin [Gammaproteobacteria bacterium]|nr:type II toxin-antitoxin system HicA family toxin [Gammaproteobacteria bacterium]
MRRKDKTSTITVPIPDHRELLIGTLMSIIGPSGVPRAEFEEAT